VVLPTVIPSRLKVTKVVTCGGPNFGGRSKVANPCPLGQCVYPNLASSLTCQVRVVIVPFMAAPRALPENVEPVIIQHVRTLLPIVETRSEPEPQPAVRHNARPRAADPVLPAVLRSYFDSLFAAHGPQHWWPGRTRFEVIVGAILTQNTSWSNVARAIRNLRTARLLSPNAIRRVRDARLAQLLRPSGYFRQKTKTLKSFVTFLYAFYSGSLTRLFATPTSALRDQLLALRGIGPETADSILLYAGKHPVFVVDAYSRRILERHGLSRPRSSYEELRTAFEHSLPREHQVFNEFHALIVHVGKNYCRPNAPRCTECSLLKFLPQSTQPVK
jgi:endonuclease-3 related protein